MSPCECFAQSSLTGRARGEKSSEERIAGPNRVGNDRPARATEGRARFIDEHGTVSAEGNEYRSYSSFTN